MLDTGALREVPGENNTVSKFLPILIGLEAPLLLLPIRVGRPPLSKQERKVPTQPSHLHLLHEGDNSLEHRYHA